MVTDIYIGTEIYIKTCSRNLEITTDREKLINILQHRGEMKIRIAHMAIFNSKAESYIRTQNDFFKLFQNEKF